MTCDRCGKEQIPTPGHINFLGDATKYISGWTFALVCLDCWKDFEAFWKRGKE